MLSLLKKGDFFLKRIFFSRYFFSFLHELDDLLQYLYFAEETFDYLFSEEFFFNLNALIFSIPELSNLKNNLKSFRDIVEFFALLKKHYEGNLKMLIGDLNYLLKVLKNLKDFLFYVDRISVKFIKQFQK